MRDSCKIHHHDVNLPLMGLKPTACSLEQLTVYACMGTYMYNVRTCMCGSTLYRLKIRFTVNYTHHSTSEIWFVNVLQFVYIHACA